MKVFFIGFMGCGKTYWGKAVSEKTGIPFFDLDEEIMKSEGKSINDIFMQDGEDYFRMVEKDILYQTIENNETFIMATGGGTPCYFNNIDFLKKNGIVVWINCSIECLHSRLVKDKNKRPLVKDLSDDQLKTYIIKKFSDRKIYYEKASVVVHEDDVVVEELINKIFHQ